MLHKYNLALKIALLTSALAVPCLEVLHYPCIWQNLIIAMKPSEVGDVRGWELMVG